MSLSDPESGQVELSSEELRRASNAASRGFVWILSSTVLWQLISWVLTLSTARVLSPEDYGLIALADTITPYLVMLASLRIDIWVLQLDRFDEDEQRVVQSFAVLVGIAIFLAAWSAAPLMADFYHRDDVVLPFRILCGVVLLRSLRVIPEARLRRALRFEPIAVANFSVGVGRATLQLLLALAGWKYWSLVTASMLAEAIQTVWMLAVAGAPRGVAWRGDLLRRAIAFGVPASLSHVCWIVFSTADNLVVGRFFGVAMLGFYAMAFYLTELPLSKLNSVLQPVLSPYYAKLRMNRPELASVVLRVNRATVMLVGPVLLGLCAVAAPFVELVFGEHWLPLVGPFRVMCLVSLLRALNGNSATLLLSLGEAQRSFRTSLVPAVVMPLAFVAGAWTWGLNGLYLAWLLVYPLVGPLFGLWMVSADLGLSVGTQLRNILSPLLASVFMALIVTALDSYAVGSAPQAVRLSADIGAGAVIGLCCLRMLYWTEARDALALFRRARVAS